MQIELNLDEMTARYVQSLETRAALYRARAWSLFAVGLLVGVITGSIIALKTMPCPDVTSVCW